MVLPTNLTIIGLGGCGKTFLHKISEHDWFLKHYLEGDRSGLNLYTIDTATGELQADRRNMVQLKEKIRELNVPSNTGVVAGDHYDLPSVAAITTIPDLIAQRVVDSLQLSSTDVWWLNDLKHGIRFEDLCELDPRLREGFEGGVYRMRAVAKAAFVKATTVAGPSFSQVFTGTGPVAIIVGLGGGTGSGIFLDLAKKIHEQDHERPIWLFALLPAFTEGETERLNAAIALTELEYLKVSDTNLFHHVLLSSLDPTGFSDIQASRGAQAVKDFSAAFPYLFINAFDNNNDNQIVSETLDYGNFINLDAYSIEYPIEDLRALERKYDDYLSCLEKTVKPRLDICHAVKTFFEENRKTYPQEYAVNPMGYQPSYEKVVLYRADINRVKDIWRNPTAECLNLQTPRSILGIIKGTLDRTIQDLDNLDSINDLYTYVHTIYDQFSLLPVQGTERDMRLHSCIMKYLECLSIVGEYYKITTCLSEPLSRKAHMEVLCVDNENTVRTQRDIGVKLVELSNAVIDYSGNIENLKEEMGNVVESSGKQRRDISSLVNERNSEIQEYCKNEENRATWETFDVAYRERFSLKCIEFANILMNANASDKAPDRITPEKRYTTFACIEESIYPTSASLKYRELVSAFKNLDREVSDYYYWNYMCIVADKEGRRFFGPSLKKTRLLEHCNTAFGNIKSICNQLNDNTNGQKSISYMNDADGGVVVNIQAENSPIIAVFDILSTSIVEKITATLCASFNLNNKQSEIADAVYSSEPIVIKVIESLTKKIYDLLDVENGWTKEITRLQSSLDDLMAKKISVENKSAYLSLVLDHLLLKTARVRIEYAESDTALKTAAADVKPDGDVGRNIDRKYKSVAGDMNPGVLPLLQDDSTLATLDDSPAGRKEIENILGIIRRRYMGLIDTRMLGTCSLARQSELIAGNRWSFGASVLVIASNSAGICEQMNSEDEKERISLKLMGLLRHENNEKAHVVVHQKAKPWECGIMFMAAGNYLENILGFELGGGYRVSYETGKNNVLHHVLNMSKGEYIIRKFLDRETALTLALNEQNTKTDRHEVRDIIRARYEKCPIRDVLTAAAPE